MKLFIVKREVLARNIKEAMKNDGNIYSIELAEDKYQPGNTKKSIGFKKSK